MVKWRIFAALLSLVPILGSQPAYCQDNFAIWKEFVAAIRNGKMTPDKIRPYEGVSKAVLLEQLANFKGYHDRYDSWKEWENPEVVPVENLTHYIVTFTWGGQTKSDFCFTLLRDAGNWYFRHLENIFIRLDRVTQLPASTFPDLPEDRKAWQREEIYWSQMVYLYSVLGKEKGREFFLNILKDGAGYFLAAKTWVPFVSPRRAFILYLCWEQSRLRSNAAVLEALSDQEATVRLQTHFFRLYRQASHLKGQITFEDYRRIFETVWRDRAAAAGWTIDIQYEDPECLQCILRFTRKL